VAVQKPGEGIASFISVVRVRMISVYHTSNCETIRLFGSLSGTQSIAIESMTNGQLKLQFQLKEDCTFFVWSLGKYINTAEHSYRQLTGSSDSAGFSISLLAFI